MQTGGKFFDDLAKLMNNAVGVAQGAKSEAENAFNSWMDRWLAERNLVTREEFDAVRSMAQLAREENEALKARVADLESAVGSGAEPLGLKKVVTLSEIAQRLDWNPVGCGGDCKRWASARKAAGTVSRWTRRARSSTTCRAASRWIGKGRPPRLFGRRKPIRRPPPGCSRSTSAPFLGTPQGGTLPLSKAS